MFYASHNQELVCAGPSAQTLRAAVQAEGKRRPDPAGQEGPAVGASPLGPNGSRMPPWGPGKG